MKKLTKCEAIFLKYIDDHLWFCVVTLCTLLGIIIRSSLLKISSDDYNTFLLPWYNEISANGLSQQVGDYNFLYQFVIWLLTKINIQPLYAYKTVSCIFDWILAVTAGRMVYNLSGEDMAWKSAIAYCGVWLSPIVFLNSAAWAQCDAIYSAFVLLAILNLERDRSMTALCLLGVGFAFKLHAVFALPLFLFAYFMKRKFSIICFFAVPLTMILISSPLVLWGRKFTEIFALYANQTNTYQAMSMNYPSIWLLLWQARESGQYANLKEMGILFTVFVLAILMIWWIRRGYNLDGQNLYIMTFLLVYTTVLFLPSMHERYGYLYEIFAIILAILISETIPLCIGLLCISLNTYGTYLFGIPVNWLFLTCVNLAVYGIYIYYLDKELQLTQKVSTKCHGR